MDINNASVAKLIVKENILYVKVMWKDCTTSLFHINIFDGSNCWSGRLSMDFARGFMRHLEENDEDYIKTVKEALVGNNPMYIYDFSPIPGEKSAAQFSWKKTYKDSTAVVDHGAVPVHIDSSITKDVLIDFLLEQNKDLRKFVEAHENCNRALTTELEECRNKLEQFIDVKTSLESSMYGKFVQLLNSKKKRIQLMEQSLKEFNDTGSPENMLD